MTAHRTRKYVAYALGEIALIVIGILIALQITNMNDERRSDAESLRDYYNDLLFYRTSINNRIGCHEGVRKRAEELLGMISRL